MLTLLRTLTTLFGIALLLLGLGWWVHPAEAANMLGASLLDGTGRSTQIGDSGAFFIGAGFLLAWGAIRKNSTLVLTGGCLVGLVAPGRVLSATLHGGAWTTDEIVGEIVMLVVAIATASLIRQAQDQVTFR